MTNLVESPDGDIEIRDDLGVVVARGRVTNGVAFVKPEGRNRKERRINTRKYLKREIRTAKRLEQE